MTKFFATIVGFIVAPLVSSAIVVGRDVLSGVLITWNATMFFFLIAYVVSFIVALVFGSPIFLLLRHFRLVTWWTALLAGAAIGAVVAVIMRLPDLVFFSDFLAMIPVGVASTFSFWLIFKYVEKQL